MDYFSQLDLVAYINLNIRTDRREEIEKQLSRVGIPKEKILRWEATRNKTNGALGCSQSHINLLEHVLKNMPDVKTILILEDDFNFVDDVDIVKKSLGEFLNYPIDTWDLGILSYHVRAREDFNDLVSIALFSQRTTGYLVNRNSMGRLIDNFKEGYDKLTSTGKIGLYSLDVYWWRFMQSRKCFYFNKSLGYQRISYSNITHQIDEASEKYSSIDLDKKQLRKHTDGVLGN